MSSILLAEYLELILWVMRAEKFMINFYFWEIFQLFSSFLTFTLFLLHVIFGCNIQI